jgi:hypothetical protein
MLDARGATGISSRLWAGVGAEQPVPRAVSTDPSSQQSLSCLLWLDSLERHLLDLQQLCQGRQRCGLMARDESDMVLPAAFNEGIE